MKDVTAQADVVGGSTFWSVPTITLPYARLLEVWLEAELPKEWLPNPPRESKAMRRALSQQKSKRRLLRPLKRGSSWALVEEETTGETGLAHDVSVVVTKAGDGSGRTGPFSVQGDYAMRSAIGDAYQTCREAVTGHDLSELLIKCIERVGGIALKRNGGIYFVPPAKLDVWARVADAIERVTYEANPANAVEVCILRPKTDVQSMKAVFNGIVAEAKQAIATLTVELQKDELGPKALTHRAEMIEGLQKKVQEYETLLGQTLPETHAAIARCRVAVVEARMVAEGKEEDGTGDVPFRLVG